MRQDWYSLSTKVLFKFYGIRYILTKVKYMNLGTCSEFTKCVFQGLIFLNA